MKRIYVLQNTKNNKYVQIVGDGSECLVKDIADANMFKTMPKALAAQEEHDKWVGPLIIKLVKVEA